MSLIIRQTYVYLRKVSRHARKIGFYYFKVKQTVRQMVGLAINKLENILRTFEKINLFFIIPRKVSNYHLSTILFYFEVRRTDFSSM